MAMQVQVVRSIVAVMEYAASRDFQFAPPDVPLQQLTQEEAHQGAGANGGSGSTAGGGGIEDLLSPAFADTVTVTVRSRKQNFMHSLLPSYVGAVLSCGDYCLPARVSTTPRHARGAARCALVAQVGQGMLPAVASYCWESKPAVACKPSLTCWMCTPSFLF